MDGVHGRQAPVSAAPDRSILPTAVGVKFQFATHYSLPAIPTILSYIRYPLRGVGLVPAAVVQGDSQPPRGGYMLPLITVAFLICEYQETCAAIL